MKMPPLVSQTQNIWFIHTCDVNRPYTFWTVSALKCFPRVCVSVCVIIFFEATTRLQFPEPLTYFHSINILPSKCNHPFNLWQAALGEKRGKLAAPLNCIYEILFISSLTSSPKLITVSRLQIECKTVLTLQIWLLFFLHNRHFILWSHFSCLVPPCCPDEECVALHHQQPLPCARHQQIINLLRTSLCWNSAQKWHHE